MVVHKLLQVSVVLFLPLIGDSVEVQYRQTNQGLINVPADIPLNVTQIDLARNALKIIGENQFAGYSTLNNLNLFDNDIRFIHPSAFEGTVIVRLQLSRNNLTMIPDLRAINTTLIELDLLSNKIAVIPLDFLQPYGNLLSLTLGWNFLTEIPILPQQQTTFALLGVQANPIQNISHFALNHLQVSGLQELLITEYGTVLKQIQPHVKSSLTLLYIQHCPEDVAKLNMEHFPLLNWLSVLDNFNLPEFPDVSILNETLETFEVLRNGFGDPPQEWLAEMLSKLTKLRSLIVDTQVVTRIDLTHSNPELTSFKLMRTSLVCNCSTAWMKRAQMNATSTLTVTTFSYLICDGPGNLAGKVWHNISLADLCPGDVNHTTNRADETTTLTVGDTTKTSMHHLGKLCISTSLL